jgi:hypothetical protein
MKKLVLTIALLLSVGSHAYHERGQYSHNPASSDVLSSRFYLSVGEMDTVKFSPRYVEQIFVQAEGAGSRDAMFEVWANGKPKGTIYVPGRDPNYIVTIKENISELKFRHISGGNVNVLEVKYNGQRSSDSWGHRPQLGNNYSHQSALEVAESTMSLVKDLKPYATYKELGHYLLPIRKSAASLYSIAANRSPYSQKVRNALLQLLTQINAANAYIDANLETEATFGLAVELLTSKEKIDTMLGN